MKSAVSFALLVTMVTSSLPAAAQSRFDPTPGPIGRAIGREAARLAAQNAPARQDDTLNDSDWMRVRKIEPGKRVLVTLRGSKPVERYFIAADASSVTLMNPSAVNIPRAARDILVLAVANHPAYFTVWPQGNSYTRGNVRIGTDGVFVNDRKVADVAQTVQRIDRTEVSAVGFKESRGRARRTAIISGVVVGGLLLLRLLIGCWDECSGV